MSKWYRCPHCNEEIVGMLNEEESDKRLVEVFKNVEQEAKKKQTLENLPFWVWIIFCILIIVSWGIWNLIQLLG